ncbi:MAG TPA: serine/threonine protein kinase [Desulfomonilia bacterium]
MTDFKVLTPDLIINSAEKAVGKRFTGLLIQHPSYINRVYELQAMDTERFVIKFYRPGRWSREAIEEEHAFIADCDAGEIPVVAPIKLSNGSTLMNIEGINLAVFPKKGGRMFEINNDEDWVRVGSIIGRIHAVGAKKDAPHRVRLHPGISTRADIEFLLEGGFIHPELRDAFKELCFQILDEITGLFGGVEYIRIHGDCHRGNLIERPGEGLMVIDLDDMMTGPPVHDLWLMLPDHYTRAKREIDLIMSGYEEFREFDYSTLKLIEPLRFMRIIYYLAWCARQGDDLDFKRDHPDWGNENFWAKELIDLRNQFQIIMEHKEEWNREHGNMLPDDDGDDGFYY